VQGQSFDCGLGPLSFQSTELLRGGNDDPLACLGVDVVDAVAWVGVLVLLLYLGKSRCGSTGE
jgi:hypothetical protein